MSLFSLFPIDEEYLLLLLPFKVILALRRNREKTSGCVVLAADREVYLFFVHWGFGLALHWGAGHGEFRDEEGRILERETHARATGV